VRAEYEQDLAAASPRVFDAERMVRMIDVADEAMA
jgi:hypothetical protein